MNLDDVIAIEAAVVHPGDTLFIAFHSALTAEDAQRIKERFAVAAPGINVVVVDQVQNMTTCRKAEAVCPKCGTSGCLEDKALDF